jgi:hypothetical protein
MHLGWLLTGSRPYEPYACLIHSGPHSASPHSAGPVPHRPGLPSPAVFPPHHRHASPAGAALHQRSNPGYNLLGCSSCGAGTVTTAGEGATSADACFTPAGHGSAVDAKTGVLTGFICPRNTFGLPNNTFGMVEVVCAKVGSSQQRGRYAGFESLESRGHPVDS